MPGLMLNQASLSCLSHLYHAHPQRTRLITLLAMGLTTSNEDLTGPFLASSLCALPSTPEQRYYIFKHEQ